MIAHSSFERARFVGLNLAKAAGLHGCILLLKKWCRQTGGTVGFTDGAGRIHHDKGIVENPRSMNAGGSQKDFG